MSQCSVCANTEKNVLIEAQEKMFGLGDKFSYLECAQCGHVEIQCVPQDLARYYPANYYSFKIQGKFVQFLKRKRAEEAFGVSNLVGWAMLKKFGPPPTVYWYKFGLVKKTDRILDVGCGKGDFIRELVGAGFSSITGVDPFIDKDIVYSPEIRVLKKSVFELTEKFDFILMSHSFEHMTNAKEVLKQSAKLLAPGGRLLLRVPLIGFAWREFRENWVGLDAPRHLFIPTEKSLELMAENSGLSLVKKEHDSVSFQFWASEQYRRSIPLESDQSYLRNPKASIFTDQDIKAYEQRSLELNAKLDGDQANFLYVRNDDASRFQGRI